MRRKKVSRKQKRVKARNLATARKVSRHLVMGNQHDMDRAAAEKLRVFPSVPRLIQPPFPRAREVGFAGHWIDGEFRIQDGDAFVEMNVGVKANAWYWYKDPRGNRRDQPKYSGVVETNVALRTGIARVLAEMVDANQLDVARDIASRAGLAGMHLLGTRTGYIPAYLVMHPDAVGTLSFHFGMLPVDINKRCLVGRSAGGRRGRRGLRLLNDAFTSVLRHHEAITLPQALVRRPLENVKERDPDDWAVAQEMDRVAIQELFQLPGGEVLVRRADEIQKEAARDWLERYKTSTSGYDEMRNRLVRVEAGAFAAAEILRLQKGETLAVAAKRIVAERDLAITGQLADRLAAETRMAEEKLALQAERIVEVEGELSAVRQILAPTDDEGIVAAARRIVKLASKPPVEIIGECEVNAVIPSEVERAHTSEGQSEAELQAATSEVQQVARVLIQRMNLCDRKSEWDNPVESPGRRATAFLNWLQDEPKRLMEKFRKLAAPMISLVHNYPQAKRLVQFFGFGKSKD